jgi:hypothetical protein
MWVASAVPCTGEGLVLLRGLNFGHTHVGSYKLPLSQYICIGLVVACSFQQKYDFSRVLLRPADVLPTPAPLRHTFLRRFYIYGAAQLYVGSVCSDVHRRGLVPL